MSMNSVNISGHLTRDAELRGGASAVLSFTVAVNERVKDSDGTWGDRANFIDCVLFGSRARAEKLQQYLTKGMKVAVSGRLHQNTWEAKDGAKRSKLEVYVNDVELMQRSQQQAGYTQPEAVVYDEYIPF